MKTAVVIPWTMDLLPRALFRSLWESDIPREAKLFTGGAYDPVIARNKAIVEGLALGCEEFLFFDGDQVFPRDIYAKLAGCGKEIVSGLVPHGNYPHCYCVYRDVPGQPGRECQWVPAPGLENPVVVKKAGSGCLFVRREVFEKVPAPWFRPEVNDTYSGWTRGEDFAFCLKAREAGYEIWAHPGVFVAHIKSVVLNRTYVEKSQHQALVDQAMADAKQNMGRIYVPGVI